MGLLVGTTLYPVISPTRRHKLIMWAFRIAAIPLAVILFVVLIRNFYTSDPYAGMLPLFGSAVRYSHVLQRVLVVDICLAYLWQLTTTVKGRVCVEFVV